MLPTGEAAGGERTADVKKQDNKLAERLALLIENANERVTPLCKQIRVVRSSVLASIQAIYILIYSVVG